MAVRPEATGSGRDSGVEILLEGALGRTGGRDAPAATAPQTLSSFLLPSLLQKFRDVGPRRGRAYVTLGVSQGLPHSPVLSPPLLMLSSCLPDVYFHQSIASCLE